MDEVNFCPACGKNVPPGTQYCPACGSCLSDQVPERRETEAEKRMGADRTKIAAILILIYSMPLILFGIYFYVAAGDLTNEIFSNPRFVELVAPYYTPGALESFIQLMGLASIIAGSIGVVTAILALMRKFWVLTIILCIMSALIGALTLFGLILGLIAFWMLYKARPVFES